MAPLLSRKKDLIYLVFFTIHIPIVFLVDIYPLYPPSLIPTFMTSLRTWYIATYRDANFVSPPAWFMLYSWLELFYHAPLSIWAIGALLRDDPRVPGHLLAYAMQTAVTTATCIADFLSWEDLSGKEKVELGKLYVPYLAVSVFMGLDMLGRLNARLSSGRLVDGRLKKGN
ncbi:Sigma intracellular receptor [Sphaerulina musiva]